MHATHRHPTTSITDHVAKLLKAEPGLDGYYTCCIENTAALFKQLPESPQSWVFRLRKSDTQPINPDWETTLTDDYRSAEIEIEDDDEYAFLWINDASALDPDAIAALAPTLIIDNPSSFPSTQDYCYHCKQSDGSRLVQDGTSIALVCSSCHQLFEHERQDEELALNPVRPAALLALPLALGIGAIGWATPWIY